MQLGLSAEIHGALVGGAIGGGVVLLGILLTEWLHRVRDDRHSVESATHELIIRLPFVLMGLSVRRPAGLDIGVGSSWWQERERSLRAMNEIRASARRRHHRKIREAVNDLSARFTAAEIRAMQGQYLSIDAVYSITDHGLYGLVFPHTRGVEELTKRYLEHDA